MYGVYGVNENYSVKFATWKTYCFWCSGVSDLFCVLIVCSKLQSDALREAISGIMADSKEKNRKFVETIELQIGLKNYDPQKDKRFSGSVKLPHIPRPKMKICMLGDAQHVEEVIIWCDLQLGEIFGAELNPKFQAWASLYCSFFF